MVSRNGWVMFLVLTKGLTRFSETVAALVVWRFTSIMSMEEIDFDWQLTASMMEDGSIRLATMALRILIERVINAYQTQAGNGFLQFIEEATEFYGYYV